MQLSAVCAAVTVSAQPGRQTEKCCSHRLTFLNLGQYSATDKTKANEQHIMLHLHGVMLTKVWKLPVNPSFCCVFKQHIFSTFDIQIITSSSLGSNNTKLNHIDLQLLPYVKITIVSNLYCWGF